MKESPLNGITNDVLDEEDKMKEKENNEKKLTEQQNAGLEVLKKKYPRVTTTLTMSPELKKIFKYEYIKQDISLSSFLENLMIEQFKKDGYL